MAEDKENKPKEELKIGLVSITGEVGVGMKLPDQEEVVEMKIDVGTAQVLAYLVQTVSQIEKNIA